MNDPAYGARKEVARVHRAFYDAIEALDIDAMERVWLDDERVQCVHPGWELLIGRARVLEAWRAIFANTSEIHFELADLGIEIHGEIAGATCVERIRSSAGDETLEAAAVATNLFLLREGTWRLMLHHASPILRREAD